MSKPIQNSQENATKVVIRGTVFPREQKAPFTVSGQSILGGQECTEDERKIRCHECGNWMKVLTKRHLDLHTLTGRQYRMRHGLRLQCALASPSYRRFFGGVAKRLHANPEHKAYVTKILADARDKAREGRLRTFAENDQRISYSEHANLKMNCRAQLTIALTHLTAQLGHTPTAKDLERARIHRRAIEWAFQMTVAEALRSIGLVPNRRGVTVRMDHIPRQILQLHGQGLNYKEIAQRLGVHPATASKYSRPPKMLKGQWLWP